MMIEKMMSIHETVLLEKAVDSLNVTSGDVVVDATLGAGGHSLRILKEVLPDGKLISIDRDQKAIEKFKEKISSSHLDIDSSRVILINENFSNLSNILDDLGVRKVDAILADFGLSSDQLDDNERGFSFLREGKLDMRLDQTQDLDAYYVVNEYSQKELEKIIRIFGEERFSKRIARKISEKRSEKKIETTLELAKIIEDAIPEKMKIRSINVATKTFQAIRMEVNHELESIEKFINEALKRLGSGGRLTVISFHSGEDRIVKKIFKEAARGCICPVEFPKCSCQNEPIITLVSKKPITPSETEVSRNPRSRSAKMRVAEKI